MLAFDTASRLDATDWAIIDHLQDHGRATWSELGKVVSLSPPAVADRVRRLEEAGVITGYRAEVNPALAGYGVIAFIRVGFVETRGRTYDTFQSFVRDQPQILECHHLTGEDCFIVKVMARSVPDLEGVIRELSRFGRTTTSIVLASPVTRRTIRPVPADG